MCTFPFVLIPLFSQVNDAKAGWIFYTCFTYKMAIHMKYILLLCLISLESFSSLNINFWWYFIAGTYLISTSLKVVSIAVTFWASFSRTAVRCRILDIFTYKQIEMKKTIINMLLLLNAVFVYSKNKAYMSSWTALVHSLQRNTRNHTDSPAKCYVSSDYLHVNWITLSSPQSLSKWTPWKFYGLHRQYERCMIPSPRSYNHFNGK